MRCTTNLDGERWAALKARARAQGLTPAAALCAAYAETLARWSRRAPMTLNLTVFDRHPVQADVDRIVGDFTNTVLLAVDPGPVVSFAERARAVQTELWQALEHAAVSGVEVLRLLNRGRARGRAVRMPVVFTAALRPDRRAPISPVLSEGLARLTFGVSQTPQVWLDHQAVELGDRLMLNWDAVEGRFPPGLLDAMFAAYVDLLDRLAADDAAWHAPADAAPPGLSARWAAYNDTAGPAGEGTLWQLLASAAARAPERPAIIAPDRTLTHRALAERAAAVHARLGDLAPGTRVAIVMRRHWAQAVAAAGVLRAGGAYVPLDAAWPAARIAGVLRDGGIERVLTTVDIRECHQVFDDMSDAIDVVTVDAMASMASPPAPAPQRPETLAYVIYTSGSTGNPKGVLIDHRGAVNTIDDINRRLGVGPEDRVLALSSLGFDLSVYDLFGVLAAGGAAVLPPADAERDPARWAARMQAAGVTLWNTVPALMGMLVEHLEQTGGRLPASLRHVMLSGDWIPVTLPDRIRALAERPPAILSLGGATEASIWSIAHPIDAVDESRPSIPYGRPLRNQRMHVLDPHLRPCPVWAVGELYIGGLGVALGYADDPAQTAARFIEHPETGERLYRTGDLGRLWPDDTIEFLGREDGQVKIGGHRIELGEIDAALGRHPALGAAVTVAVGEAPGPRRLVAYVVPQADAKTDAPPPVEYWPAQVPVGWSAAWSALETQCIAAICRTLRRLGAFGRANATSSPEAFVASGAVDPPMRRLLYGWMTLLAERGLLEPVDGTHFRAPRPLPDAPPDWRAVPLVEGLPREAIALSAAFAERHLDLLAGRRLPTEVAFPDGDLQGLRAIYSRVAPMRVDVELLVTALTRLAARRPNDRPLRVFEVGAGTGAAAQAVVEALGRARLDYLATDLSPVFADGLRAILGEAGRFGLFDMERDAHAQGIATGSWDAVIAHQVVHNAADLTATLTRLTALLAPDGRLLVTEAAGDGPFTMVGPSFLSVAPGQDPRRPHLHDDTTWRAAFAAAGLRPVEVRPDADDRVFQQMRLYIVPPPSSFDREALRADLARVLPGYMVPDAFVVLPELPLSPTGKVDRRRLPSPDLPTARGREAIAPRNPIEEALVELWAEQLGRAGLGIHDDFFESGGDSLSAVRLIGRIRRRLGVDLPLRHFFTHSTVAELAPLMVATDAHAKAALPGVEPDAAARFEPFPLTEVQHAYWIGQQSGLELGGTPCQVYLEFAAAEVDPARFEAAVQGVIARHDALRSVVHRNGRQQTLREVPAYRVIVDDARPDPEHRLAATRQAMRAAATDPSVWPLFEFRLTRLADEWRIHWRQDALFSDGWSIFLILRELGALYAGASLPPPPALRFRDYVQALSAVRESEAWREASAWWDARIETLPPAPELPLACDPATLGTPRFVRSLFELSPERWQKLRAMAERLKVTPSTALLVAFTRVLAGWSRHPHFTLNLTLFNRLPVHADVDRLVGDFTTLSLLECDVRADEPLAEAATRLQGQLWADLDRRIVGAVEVIRRLATRSADGPRARMPIVFTSTLGFEAISGGNGLIERMVDGWSQTPQVWLDHQVWTAGGRLCLNWDTVEGLFPPGMVEAMFSAYVRTVQCLADDEGAWHDLGALPPVLPDDQRARRAALVATEGPRPAGLLHDGIFAQAARTPAAAAVIAEDGRALRYGALCARARALADRLIASGVERGERVAVLLPKGPAQIIALVAVLDAGAAYVPIDPGQPAPRVTRMLAACGARRAIA
ncbi:MAG: amino acid adenylation domain-containing protein, partial [Myxococcales bacterium]|nr:amino acid adenylation domain-containing protein [Myxococcales bacterium]